MKSVTEFAKITIVKAQQTKANLVAEGKTPEEIELKLGELCKMEGDKLKYLMNAIGVAEQNAEGLKRVIVYNVAEGENAPNKAIKVDEMHYFPEFYGKMSNEQPAKKLPGKGGKGDRGGKGGRGGERAAKAPKETAK